jgi:hypothetical protein
MKTSVAPFDDDRFQIQQVRDSHPVIGANRFGQARNIERRRMK